MSKRTIEKIQNDLDKLKDLKLVVCDPLKTVITIHGGVTGVTLHAKKGQPQNRELFPAMMKALKEKLNENIKTLQDELKAIPNKKSK